MLLGLHDFGSIVLPSRVWGQLAITASTFSGSLKVTKPNPRERPAVEHIFMMSLIP